jgi:glycine hydroxymethyltransferase
VTLVSKIYEVEFYHVDPKTKVFDYDQIEKQAFKFKPKLLVSGGTAYPREIDYREMAAIAHRAGAYYLADVAHEAGLIIGGANQSPFPFADFVSLTTHKTLRGPRGAMVICRKELAEKLDASVFPGLQGGPHLHTIAGIAVALAKSQTPDFRQYALQTVKNARFLAAFLQKKGLEVVSGGTEKHLVLVDLRNTGVSGWTVAWALERAGICANRNTVPQENASPFYPSGLRLGTPAVTVRGMKEPEMAQIGEWILKAINHVKGQKIPENQDQRRVFLKNFLTEVKKDKFLQGINREVKKLCQKFPIR